MRYMRRPVQGMPSAAARPRRMDGCPDTRDFFPEETAIAMAYVPWQVWEQPYPLEQGFNRGTIFPELDLPFVMGRCM